jgi:hypothetical protein
MDQWTNLDVTASFPIDSGSDSASPQVRFDNTLTELSSSSTDSWTPSGFVEDEGK